MTGQEIESLQSILNQKELECSSCGEDRITNVVKFSIVPKAPEGVRFKIIGTKLNSEVIVRSLPAIELTIALPDAYPSHTGPQLTLTSDFYTGHLLGEFLLKRLEEKWSEEMPVLYEMAIFLQEEFLEQFFEEHP